MGHVATIHLTRDIMNTSTFTEYFFGILGTILALIGLWFTYKYRQRTTLSR